MYLLIMSHWMRDNWAKPDLLVDFCTEFTILLIFTYTLPPALCWCNPGVGGRGCSGWGVKERMFAGGGSITCFLMHYLMVRGGRGNGQYRTFLMLFCWADFLASKIISGVPTHGQSGCDNTSQFMIEWNWITRRNSAPPNSRHTSMDLKQMIYLE